VPAAQKKCPHCGAKVSPAWANCWLCGLKLNKGLPAEPALATGQIFETDDATASPPNESAGVVATIGKAAGFFLAGIIALIMLGLLANGEIGGAIFFLLLLLPAGLVTVTKSLRWQSKGVEFTVLEKLGTFLMSLAVTIGAVVLLGIAAFAALCVACIVALSTNSGNMFR
jgi:hypothetical protein